MMGRSFVIGALVLASVGVYIGRVLRWNSWDALARPESLLGDLAERIANPFAFPLAWIGTAAFALFLIASYQLVLRAAGCRKQDAAD